MDLTGGRAVSRVDLMGRAEIAVRLGIDARRARALTARPDFPEPCARISAGPIWEAADVEAWIKEHWRWKA